MCFTWLVLNVLLFKYITVDTDSKANEDAKQKYTATRRLRFSKNISDVSVCHKGTGYEGSLF